MHPYMNTFFCFFKHIPFKCVYDLKESITFKNYLDIKK